MKRLWLRCWQLALRRLGPRGLLAATVLVPITAIVAALPQLSARADALRSTVAEQSAVLSQREQAMPRRLSSGEELLAFVSRFPPLTQSAADLDQVFAFAKRRNVVLAKGEYQLKAEPNTSLVTYTAVFPVRNEYVVLKSFAADVLGALPHVSLDELRMTRNDATSGSLDSVVRLTFVYRSP